MGEKRRVFEDPAFGKEDPSGGQMPDLRAMEAASAVILFARALETFGMEKSEAAQLAEKIFKTGGQDTAAE